MNYYAEAIDIITPDRHDWRQIVANIAKKHPKAVVDAAKSDWKTEAEALVNSGNKIGAIKLCRAFTGQSLVDAKSTVEAMERK